MNLDALNISKKSKIFSWETFIFTLYIAITIFTVFHHEPWRDEAHIWLVVRDLPFLSIFSQVCYDGTPALWYVILAPFIKLGFPYFTMNLIHLVVIFFTVFLFIYKSPFSIYTKFLFVFSHHIIWEYSIMARHYSIGVLLLILIASCYKDRFQKPVLYSFFIFLLFNANVHSFFIAGAFAFVYLLEFYKKEKISSQLIIAFFIISLGILVSVLQLVSPPDNIHYGFFPQSNSDAPLHALKNAFFPRLPFDFLKWVAAGLILSTFIYLYKSSRSAFFILLLSCLGLGYIFIFQHKGQYRHNGFILIVVMVMLWISLNKQKAITNIKSKMPLVKKFTQHRIVIIGINISLAIAIIPGAIRHYLEINYLFSGSKEMAQYLKSHELTNELIVAHKSPHTSAILPYLPNTKFWYPGIEEYGTFVTWNNKYQDNEGISFEEIIHRIDKNKISKDNLLLLLSNKIPENKTHKYRLLHQVEVGISSKETIFLQLLHQVEPGIFGNESYYLYREL